MVDALSAVIRDEPRPLAASPLSGIVTRCLEKEVSKRYQSMAEVRAALEDAGNKARVTPLLVAAEQGHAPVVELLIVRGADINARELYG